MFTEDTFASIAMPFGNRFGRIGGILNNFPVNPDLISFGISPSKTLDISFTLTRAHCSDGATARKTESRQRRAASPRVLAISFFRKAASDSGFGGARQSESNFLNMPIFPIASVTMFDALETSSSTLSLIFFDTYLSIFFLKNFPKMLTKYPRAPLILFFTASFPHAILMS